MGIDSRIIEGEKVENTEFKFGETIEYFPAYLEDKNGSEIPLMFTEHELEVARIRASKNPEDMPEDKSFFEKLFKG